MTKDIVERLREASGYALMDNARVTVLEAAAEIERLRGSPVTEPMPKEKRAEVSVAEPVAWAVMDGNEYMEFCTDKEEARCAAGYYAAGPVIPLYRHQQTTLTDAEREAVDTAEASLMRESTDLNTPLPVRQRLGAAAATLRGLLERMK